MSTKRQRRPLDPSARHPVSEIAMKALQCLEVDGMLVDPHHLHELTAPCRAQQLDTRLVHEREPIVRPCITFGRAAPELEATWRSLDGHFPAIRSRR